MKRIHYLAAIGLSAMIVSSCTNDEVMSTVSEPNVIGFKAMANKSSRADGSVSTQNIDRFRVFGCVTDNNAATNHSVIFNSEIVTREDLSSNNWSYTNTQYWAPNKDYYFVAISTNNMEPKWTFTVPDTHDATLKVGETFKGYGTVEMNIAEENADRDLVYAYASRATNAEMTDASQVHLTFNHMLSRIVVNFKNDMTTSGYTMSISNIKIGGLTAAGSVDLGVAPSALAWKPANEDPGTTVSVSIPDGNGIAIAQALSSDSKFIIPGSQELEISFDVDVKLNGAAYSKRSMSGKIAEATYAPGCSYKLNASISAENIVPGGAKPIEFIVDAVNTWGDDTDSDVDFN